jgi:excisionase family DNA binding protein
MLTVTDLAKRLMVSTATVKRWIKREGLPARRLSPRCLRFDANEVERWSRKRRTEAAPAK